ncbi:hypothetical protein BJ322DRAFT_673089 [Thelephora terrestris]|uniref:DUF6533 domain-containing protein n=1 Tax=Thelephora terrestris TaxID=56493 RepID=A0A9P6L7I7_9AGAM|nr:hypothetical protein BJ322DRAFT_673089 [Thelephora terrestris]
MSREKSLKRFISRNPTVVQVGQDVKAYNYYAIAAGAILFYDYFLTLADEVKYVWSGKKSWVFWLFVFNRYFPMTWQLIALFTSLSSQVTTEMRKSLVLLSYSVCRLHIPRPSGANCQVESSL